MRYALALILLLLAVPAQAETLTIGERTGWRGVFCKTVEAADRVFTAETEAQMVAQYNREPHCVLVAAPIQIVKQIKTYNIGAKTLNLVEVKTPDGVSHFITTSLKVEVAGLAI